MRIATRTNVRKLLTFLILFSFTLLQHNLAQESPKQSKPQSRMIQNGKDWLNSQRVNPETGLISSASIARAKLQAIGAATDKTAANIEWQEVGPNNFAGRTRALLIDQQNSNRLLAGSASGGIWISEDAGGNWREPMGNNLISTSVSCLHQTADGKIFLGTGEGFQGFSGIGILGFPGEGIFVSENGGENFQQTNAKPEDSNTMAQSEDWISINHIASDGQSNRVYAATNKGLFFSQNAFETFTKPIDSDDFVYDLKVSTNGTVYAFQGDQFWRSTDGTNFVDESGNIPFELQHSRKVLALSPTDPDYVYALILDLDGCFQALLKSVDSGNNWSTLTALTGEFFSPMNNGEFCIGNTSAALSVSPADKDKIMLGGHSLWSYSNQYDWNQIDGGFDLHKLPDGKHGMIYDEQHPGRMYIISDEGIHRSLDAEELYPTFHSRSKSYNTTQFFGIGAGHDGQILGGTENHGNLYSNFYEPTNSYLAAHQVLEGVGGLAEISNIKPNIIFGAQPYGAIRRGSNYDNFLGVSILDCTVDSGPGWGPYDCILDGHFDGAEQYIMPFTLWEDLELYYHLYQAVEGDIFDPQDANYPFSFWDLRFEFSSDPNQWSTQELESFPSGATVYLRTDANTGQVIDQRIVRAKYLTGTSQGEIWINTTPLDLIHNHWYAIGRVPGVNQEISELKLSPDGKTLFVGTNPYFQSAVGGGTIARFTGLDDYIPEPDTDGNIIGNMPDASSILGSVSHIELQPGRFITGIAINPNNPNQIFVSAGNYEQETNVWYCNNAMDEQMVFNSLQSDLPNMPVYDLAFLQIDDQSSLLAGTEHGVWQYDIPQDTPTGSWQNQSGPIQNTPVLCLRAEPMGVIDPVQGIHCQVVYAGTNGRGAFRSVSFSECPAEQTNLPEFSLTAQESLEQTPSKMTVYPNPGSDYVHIDIETFDGQAGGLNIHNVQGKIIKQVQFAPSSGASNHLLGLSIGDLPAGLYFLNFQSQSVNSQATLMVQARSSW